ncbi:drug/metabolite transporter (DMT)-like permease [Labrenzia sp. EL_159]|nr:drug/metabolite transporter (DMT)-like permease [Labrenzia sp. EL_162]MBG6193598.1 drug/metabolite transporter (DMT)-like permease [Labrenzia sp. EL_159]
MHLLDLCRIAGTVFFAVTLIVAGDTCGKLLTAGGVDPFFVAFSRFAIGALALLPIARIRLHELSAYKDWRVVLRAVFITCAICSILTALKTEPIANVFGAFFVGPVISYVLAVIFLAEKPSPTHTILLVLGFCGVLLVVKPGFGASAGILFAVLAGICYGCYLFMTKLLAGAMRPSLLLMSQLLIGSVLLIPFGLSSGLPEQSFNFWVLIILSALGSAAGNYALVVANKMADASLVAPLVYSKLISATLLGILVFGDWPDTVAFIGLTLIILSGLGSLAARRRLPGKTVPG